MGSLVTLRIVNEILWMTMAFSDGLMFKPSDGFWFCHSDVALHSRTNRCMKLQTAWGSNGVRHSRQPKEPSPGISSHRIPHLTAFTFHSYFAVDSML